MSLHVSRCNTLPPLTHLATTCCSQVKKEERKESAQPQDAAFTPPSLGGGRWRLLGFGHLVALSISIAINVNVVVFRGRGRRVVTD